MSLQLIAILLEIVAFIIDLLVPPGYADWLLYILPLLIILPTNQQKYLLGVAYVASALLIYRTILFPFELGRPEFDLPRRSAGFAALWILTFVLSSRIKWFKAVEDTATLNEAIFSSMADGLVLTNAAGTIVKVNPAAASIAGLKSEQEGLANLSELDKEWTITDRDGNVLSAEQWPFYRSLRGEIFEQMVYIIERKVDRKKWYGSFSGASVYTRKGQLRIGVTTFRDVTDITLAEQRLIELNEELIKRADDLELTNRDLEAFSYSASHDLRAPLQAIMSYTDIIREEYGTALNEEARDFLSRIQLNGRQMAQLISDLLSLSRAGHQEMKRAVTSLSEIASDIIKEFRRNEPDRQVEVIIEENLTANVDPGLFKIALSNLLRNAWKFTQKQPQPRIEFHSSQVNGYTTYFVQDNGAGFDMKNADSLFQPFKRLHSEKEFKGTGIGLTIVQRIINRHRGKVWAEGKAGEGARFYFTIG